MPSTFKTPSMQDLLDAGVHFGHQTRRGNPKMRDFIYGEKGGVHIINLEDTEKKLKEALQYVYNLGKNGKTLLFISTKKQSQDFVKEAATKSNAPFINYRWIGGLLTNFEEMRRNIKRLLELKELKEKGQLNKYTKKEQLLISRKLEKFDLVWGGISAMETLPDAVFIGDVVTEKTALYESNKLKIPVVGVTDSNSDPSQVTYPIPGNDDAIKAIKIIVEAVGGAYSSGKSEGQRVGRSDVKEKAGESEKSEATESGILTTNSTDILVAEEELEKEAVKEGKKGA